MPQNYLKKEIEMDKNKICEAMYALPEGLVVKRRKSLLSAILLIALGVTFIVLNKFYADSMSHNLQSALVFSGGVLLVLGVIVGSIRLFGSGGDPYYKGDNTRLCYNELYFDRLSRDEVLSVIREGAVKRLFDLPHIDVPAIVVVVYRTIDCRFAVMQAYEYVDLEYRPLTNLEVVNR